jgi:hypothetical protein
MWQFAWGARLNRVPARELLQVGPRFGSHLAHHRLRTTLRISAAGRHAAPVMLARGRADDEREAAATPRMSGRGARKLGFAERDLKYAAEAHLTCLPLRASLNNAKLQHASLIG